MNIFKKIQNIFSYEKMKFFQVNSNLRLEDINEEIYKKYSKGMLPLKNITKDKIVNGVLTICIPKNMKGNFNKILIISE